MQNHRLLVVTATLGRSIYLSQTIKSVLKQQFLHSYCIVSPEPDKIRPLLPDDPRITLIAEPPLGKGMYAAINIGIKHSWEKCSIFAYVNDDDILLDSFAYAVERCARGDVAYVYGKTNYVDSASRALGPATTCLYSRMLPIFLKRAYTPLVQVSCVFSISHMRQAGLFNESYKLSADYEYLLRLSLLYRIASLDVVIAEFRIHGAQLTRQREKMNIETLTIANAIKSKKMDVYIYILYRLAFYPHQVAYGLCRMGKGSKFRTSALFI